MVGAVKDRDGGVRSRLPQCFHKSQCGIGGERWYPPNRQRQSYLSDSMRRRPYHAVVQRQTKPLARRQVGVHNIGVQTV